MYLKVQKIAKVTIKVPKNQVLRIKEICLGVFVQWSQGADAIRLKRIDSVPGYN